jgi:hypothetical protein
MLASAGLAAPAGRVLVVTCALLALVLAPAVANADVVAGAIPVFPVVVTVGQTGVHAALTITNRDTAPDTADTNSVCAARAASPPCASPEPGITLLPACKQLDDVSCAADGADPGVFALSPGIGLPGTACAGTIFLPKIVDPTFGTVRFTPQPAGSHVRLVGSGASCTIDFSFDVLKLPTGDANARTPGIQTAQTTQHTQWAGVFAPDALHSTARGSSEGMTVRPPGPPPPPEPLPAPAPRCFGKPATIVMGTGQTVATGTAGPDVIVGNDAADTIDGRGGDDRICGGKGDDTLRGGSGDDLVRGEAGNDDVRGDSGDDRLGGGDGADRVDGGSGNDELAEQTLGGKGRDRLFGGTGRDRILAADGSLDRIDCGSDRDSAHIDRGDRVVRCEVVSRTAAARR